MQHPAATASYIYIYIIFWTHTLIHGFNLDLLKPTIYSGPTDSDFGYSVALSINDFRGSQVLIGAPRANTTALLNNNVLNGGAVYRCPVGKCVKTVATALASMGVVIHLPPWYTWSVRLDLVAPAALPIQAQVFLVVTTNSCPSAYITCSRFVLT